MDEKTTMFNLLQGKMGDRQLTLDLSRAQTKSYAATKFIRFRAVHLGLEQSRIVPIDEEINLKVLK